MEDAKKMRQSQLKAGVPSLSKYDAATFIQKVSESDIGLASVCACACVSACVLACVCVCCNFSCEESGVLCRCGVGTVNVKSCSP